MCDTELSPTKFFSNAVNGFYIFHRTA
jgi:hypothetical protein